MGLIHNLYKYPLFKELLIDEEANFIKSIKENNILDVLENYLIIEKGSLVIIGRIQ